MAGHLFKAVVDLAHCAVNRVGEMHGHRIGARLDGAVAHFKVLCAFRALFGQLVKHGQSAAVIVLTGVGRRVGSRSRGSRVGVCRKGLDRQYGQQHGNCQNDRDKRLKTKFLSHTHPLSFLHATVRNQNRHIFNFRY